MHIGIDARMYGLEHAGIGRYIANLIQNLVKVDVHTTYTLFLSSKYYRQINLPSTLNQIPVDIRHYTLKEQLFLPRYLRQAQVEIMHFPHFNVPLSYHHPFVVTIHDLLWHQFRGLSMTTLSPFLYTLKYVGYRAVVNHALKRSQKIIVPSLWVKQQLLQQSNLKSEKIVVIPEGIGPEFVTPTTIPAVFPQIPCLTPSIPFLVYTGSAYPHKNLQTLVQAMQIINQSRPLQLLIISSRTVFLHQLQELVKKLKLTHRIIFAGYLTDQEIISCYQYATALIQPSLSEGFGLTGLEAMAVGLPVIASKAGSLPEVYSDAAIYFSPHHTQELIDTIIQLLDHQTTRQQLRLKGQQRAKQFSWRTTAQKTLEVYRQVYQSINHHH